MNKQIEFTYEGVDYTLEYDRASIRYMENNGLDMGAISSRPATMMSILWQGAFLKNHKKETPDKIQRMYEGLKNKSDLNAALIEMVSETYTALYGDSEEDDSKNIEWKMS